MKLAQSRNIAVTRQQPGCLMMLVERYPWHEPSPPYIDPARLASILYLGCGPILSLFFKREPVTGPIKFFEVVDAADFA